jgi:steroid delta-isomerase-like uncharacterized protein
MSLAPAAVACTIGVAALVGLASVGCSSENAAAPPPPPVDWHAFDVPHGPIAETSGPTPRERAAAGAYAAALASPEMEGLAALLDGDVHFTFGGAHDARGKEATLNAHKAIFGAFDKRQVAVTRVWRTDGEQTVEWTMSGVQAHDWMGVPATGKPVTFRGCTLLFTKDDGTLREIHVYVDVAVVKTQLGAGPKELAGLPPATMPAGTPQVIDQAHTPEEARNVTVAKAALDALEKNDEAAFLATMADDVQVETAERPAPMHGRDDLKAYFRQMHKAIGQLDTTVDNAWGVGDYAIVEYFVSGEQIAQFAWIPPQRDRVIRLEMVDVLEIKNGKIGHVWRYADPAEIAGEKP